MKGRPIRALGMLIFAATPAASLQRGEEPRPRVEVLLREIAERADPRANATLNTRRAAMFRQECEGEADPRKRIELTFLFAHEALLAGETELAIAQFRILREALEGAGASPQTGILLQIRERLGVAYLRLGEQENCIAHHGIDSCLLPIRGSGVHRNPRGALLAIEQYAELLRDSPSHLGYRWLLNLAHMAAGSYPDGVPEEWRLAPQVYDSGVEFPRFVDVAPAARVAATGLSGGAIVEDFDGDGLLDILASSWGLEDPLRYFRNEGDGRFSDRTASAGLQGQLGGLNLCHADVDNDGDADVLVLRGAWLFSEGHHPNSLLRNRGDGTFEDVTVAAGLLQLRPTSSAAFADFDNDGRLDLFIGNESTSKERHPCELYRNEGDGTFREVAARAGLDVVGFVKGVAWGDVDDDGFPDLYLSRFGESNLLFRNEGPGTGWRFTDVTARAGVSEPARSFPVWFWDFDNDGHQDLLVAPFSGFLESSLEPVVAHRLGRPTSGERARLYRNRGDGTFSDVAGEVHLDEPLLAMGANFGDLDNDGFLDAYFGTGEPSLATLVPNRMFRNVGGRDFEDVTAAGGFGHLQKGHGIAFGDLDDDGDQDIYAVMGGAYEGDVYPNVLFRNPGTGNRWVTLVLEGVLANRGGVGARIAVVVEEGEGERTIHSTVGTGGSFGSSSLRQEIGLGGARRIRRIEIRWPGGRAPQVFESVPMDRVLRIREGEAAPATVARRTFVLGGAGEAPASPSDR